MTENNVQISKDNPYFAFISTLGNKNLDKKTDFTKVYELMFDAKNNLDMKCDISNVYAFSALKSFADFLKELGLVDSSQEVYNFQEYLKVFGVSGNRQSRKEAVELSKAFGERLMQQNDETQQLLRRKLFP